MFNEETCVLCGECLSQCPFLDMSVETAQDEIITMIETRTSETILTRCAACGYCNSICPTESNPLSLMREIKANHYANTGVPGMFLNTQEVTPNMLSMCSEVNAPVKAEILNRCHAPGNGREMFHLGCGVPHIFPDLVQTTLLDTMPITGGMEFCCGGYIYSFFGEEEAKQAGRKFLKTYQDLGVEKLVTYCPECDGIISGLYPKLIEEFNIETQTFIDYLLERVHNGDLTFPNKIDMSLTFHDPCPWRGLDSKVYDGPRELLRILGADVVEMDHHGKESLCCGFPKVPGMDPGVSDRVAGRRVAEARAAGADAIVVNCTGCIQIAGKARENGLDTFHITELVQMAIGEHPPHRCGQVMKETMGAVMRQMQRNPGPMMSAYVVKNGEFIRPGSVEG